MPAPAGVRLTPDLFVAHVVGRSMEPRIPDGSLNPFRFHPVGSRQSKILLIQRFGALDDTARFSVKRYTSRKVEAGEDQWRHERIRLEPLNPEFEAWDAGPDDSPWLPSGCASSSEAPRLGLARPVVRPGSSRSALAAHRGSVSNLGLRNRAAANPRGGSSSYYHRFLERFPTVEALAAAEEPEVLALWSGLGYYSRARNLLRAARQIAARGAFPRHYDDLRQLAGTGDYTAAAVASIAFAEPRAVLDGNVTGGGRHGKRCREHRHAQNPRAFSRRRRKLARPAPAGDVQPGADGTRGHGLPAAAPALPECPLRACQARSRELWTSCR